MTTPLWRVHPAADLFPLMEGDEFDQLVVSIRDHGLEHPIVLSRDGVLLDGRNRLRACEKLGITPRSEMYAGDDHVDYIVRVNIERRHLTGGQKAAIGVELEPHYEAEARKLKAAAGRRSAPGRPAKDVADRPQVTAPKSRDKAAKRVGTSGRSVGRAKRIKKDAPDLYEKVLAGTLDLDPAEKQVARRQHRAAESKARDTKLSNVTADAEGDWWRLLHGDFRERLLEFGDGTIDAIVTDPPYPAEFLPMWSDLAKHAARVLKPQGLLLAVTGQIFLPEVIARCGEHLAYGWCYCQQLPGQNSRIMGRRIAQTWKPWLAYSNGPWPSGMIDWHEDTTDTSKVAAKSRYRWEQTADPAAYLIDKLTAPDAIVLDPFAGTGTYGVAAISMGRRFIGCEADGDRFDKAAERLRGAK